VPTDFFAQTGSFENNGGPGASALSPTLQSSDTPNKKRPGASRGVLKSCLE
jgi:hypothetical protein